MATCQIKGQRHADVIVFGDEPAGLMTALEVRRQLLRLGGKSMPKVLVVSDADISAGLGGTIARSGLAYLDRNQVPRDMRALLGPFAASSELYGRMLRLMGVRVVAVDPRRASRTFRRALAAAGIPVLPRAKFWGVQRQGPRLCTLRTSRYGSLGADLFIDASLSAQVAHRSDVAFLEGLGPRTLRDDSLALGWIFEVEGLSLNDLQRQEERLSRRLLDPSDLQAQGWLHWWPDYSQHPRRLLADLLDEGGRFSLAYPSTSDSADVRSPALTVAFHGLSGWRPVPAGGRVLLDQANIALLPGRLSFNALLFPNDAVQNRQVLAGGNRPLPWMRPPATAVTRFFRSLGATKVVWMPELYVRSADQIALPAQSLGVGQMAVGGVDRSEALGTFTYPLDFRGDASRLLPKARPTFNFGYRHTLPREIDNLAVLGPAAGYAGPGEGIGRIVEFNVSVGQGLAIATALALVRHQPLAALDPREVARLMPGGVVPYGRPSGATALQLLLDQMSYRLQLLWTGHRL
ncbi:FAD-dependent oxidoreductase [Synechococcus sp. 1G10]|uniref:FAD-dependent oxidoreductase n=1 Tax=Synechococcus sp. 1G10 TaxID=2025605 RepID=UPI000B98A41B|nr:FAD-dependent oxidoreductase [Synechococcus sp. 1G10]